MFRVSIVINKLICVRIITFDGEIFIWIVINIIKSV